MYLKKLKIFGFKSFADEVTFEFNKGIAAVVGPNGCGKSNVVDAFNWVLGEQSPSKLRGEKMTDMLFKGSRSREPLSYAYVELIMDNSKDLLPVDYNEVTITRKLYRSGESEYFINKNPCRLKDIKQLFLDTGIGTRSYSVMEQNNVDLILNSSPQERRSIIEEVAGTRKYKEKKLETQRRLERIRDDLGEVKNIMAEVQKNIRRLKRQTNRAKRYKRYKKELRYLTISQLCQEYKDIDKKLNDKLKNIHTLEKEIADLSSKKGRLTKKVTDLENKKEETDELIIEKNKKISQVKSQITIISERINNFKSTQKRLQTEIERLNSNLKYNKKSIKELNDKIESATESNSKNKLEQNYRDFKEKSEKLSEKKQNLSQKIKDIKNSIENSERDLSGLRNKKIDLKSQKKASQTKLQELKEKKEELASSYEEINKTIQKEEKHVKKIQEDIQGVTENNKKLQKKLNVLNENLKTAEKKREDLLKEYHTRKSELDSGKKYLPQLLSIEKIADENFTGIQGPISAILKENLSEKNFKKIISLIGEKSSWMIAQNRKKVIKAITFLKKNNFPPLTFIILDHLPEKKISTNLPVQIDIEEKYEKIIAYLTENCKIKDDLIWKDNCVITGGGEIPVRSRHLLSLENDIKQLKKKLTQKEKEIEDIKNNKEDIREKINDINSKKDKFRNKLFKTNQKISQLQGNYEYTGAELEKTKDLLSNIKEDRKNKTKINGLIKKEKKINNNIFQKTKKLQNLENKLTKITEKLAEVNAHKNNLKEQKNQQKNNIKKFKNDRKRLQEDIENIKKSLQDLTAQLKNNKKRNTKDKDKIADLEKEKTGLTKIIQKKEKQRNEYISVLKRKKKDLKTCTTKLEKKKESAGNKKQTKSRLKERIKNIKNRLNEDMEISLKKALKDYRKEKVNREEITDLKNKISRIGNVNLEAPSEYKKEQERFDFIREHVEDLESSDENLQKIIHNIEKNTRKKFEETFNKVNKNFQKIFKKLFEGGSARLELTDSDNLLESGIKIKAKPAGKKMNSLKLISGGEKSMCAIALMFAVYEVKPTPFCILDEVDSQLDETNLRRFLRMLNDYTDTTQFIMITHNKLTMEICDTFYGVTMEEFGVSKIISVKLREARAAAEQ
ncbi:MAG: AAA family ATPase [Elusimicrobiota bacterium]